MNKRLTIFKLIIIVSFVFLVFRVGYLQFVRGDYYYQLSEGNRTSLRPISAPRGKMLDRNGEIVVANTLAYNLFFLPNEVPPELSREEVFRKITDYTGYDLEELEKNYQRELESAYNTAGILLRRNISRENMVILEENNDELPGVFVEESSIRDYIYGEISAHNFGYVGEISSSELRSMSDRGYEYRGKDIIGKTGLEREYELYLKGIDGLEQIEVNNVGEKVQTLGLKPPQPGNDLMLNIDMELQKVVHRTLEEELLDLSGRAEEDEELVKPTGGVVIVMEPDSGRVLSMASLPSFDLNLFAGGISSEKYNELVEDPTNPLWNRPVRAVLPPGSIFKLVTGTAAIEKLGISGDRLFYDEDGLFRIPNWSRPFRNWHDEGEGELDFTRAIARSNNIVFYELGYKLFQEYRGEVLSDYAQKYGLGSKTDIDLPGEREGIVADPDWKRRNKDEGWYPGDSVNLSIGQGDLLTTSIQLIQIINVIANRGTAYRPYIVEEIVNSDGGLMRKFYSEEAFTVDFDSRVYDILEEGMVAATNTSYGTAGSEFMNFPVKVAGKTGTAQTGWEGSNHGWFAGYAPVDEPEVSFLVFLENGNSSTFALPIASRILEEYFGFASEEEANEEESENGYIEN